MKKWSFAVMSFGFLFVTYASITTPVNYLSLFSGLFYVVLGIGMFFYSKKKEGRRK